MNKDVPMQIAEGWTRLSKREIKKWLKTPSKINTLPFKDQLTLVLKAKGQDRQNLILSSNKSRELVQAIPEEELFFTIKEIGEADALELITLTTPRQMEYIFDIEFWLKDKFRAGEALKWFRLLQKCGEEKIFKTLHHMSLDILVVFLKKYIRVYKLEEEEGIQAGKNFFTLDNFYYLDFKYKKFGRTELENLIKIMRDMDPGLYMRVMESLYWEIDAEIEEEAFRFRCARMADKGFPDLEQAQALYQFIEPDKCRTYETIKDEADFKLQGKRWGSIIPSHYFNLGDEKSFLNRVILANIGKEHFDRLVGEMVSISNKVLIADTIDLSNLELVSETLKKASSYINIGLEYLAQRDFQKGIEVISQWYLEHIFRVGFSLLLKLRRKAHAIKMDERFFPGDDGWCLLVSPYRDVIQGLVERPPLLYEGVVDPKKVEYRHFRNLREVNKIDKLLDNILFWGELHFSVYEFRLDDIRKLDFSRCYPSNIYHIDFTMLSLTAFANQVLDGEFKFSPVKRDRLNIFLSTIFKKGEHTPLHIKTTVKNGCYRWLQSLLRGKGKRGFSYAKEFWDSCFNLLEEEYGNLDFKKPVDPKFTKYLLIDLS